MRSAHLIAGVLALIPVASASAQHPELTHAAGGVHSHRGVGPHFIDAFYTENAYIERKVRPDVLAAFGDRGDQYTGQIEVEWALRSDVALIAHAPVHHAVPDNLASQTGVGDVSLGAKVAVVNNRQALIVGTGADLGLPTGDETRGLGEGHAVAAPFVLVWVPFGSERRWLAQAATHLEVPLEVGHSTGAEVSAAFSWTSPLGVTPILEGLASWEGDGGPVTWWFAPEVRWEVKEGWELGGGARARASGLAEPKFELVAGMIHHFPLP